MTPKPKIERADVQVDQQGHAEIERRLEEFRRDAKAIAEKHPGETVGELVTALYIHERAG